MREQSQQIITTRPLKLLFVGDNLADRTESFGSEIVNDFYCDLNSQILDEDLYPPISEHTACSDNKEKNIVRIIICTGLRDYLFKMSFVEPDYVFIAVDARIGITPMTKEYMGIALTLHRPISLLVSKTELTTMAQYTSTLKTIEEIVVRAMKKEFIPLYKKDLILNMKEIANKMKEGHAVTTLVINSIGREGQRKLNELMSSLEATFESSKEDLPCEIWVKAAWCVSKEEILCDGIIKTGKVTLRKYLRLGPVNGKFFTILVNKISTHDDNLKTAVVGESVIIKGTVINEGNLVPSVLTKNSGLIAIEKVDKKRIAKTFDVEIAMLKKETIKSGKIITMVSRNVCENIEVEDIIEKDVLNQGDRGIAKCSLESMEYIKTGDRVFFMTDAVIAVGVISKVYK